MSISAFLRAHARLLGFGFVLTFFGAFGQTFFIAMFSDPLRAAFDLSHFGFGLVYSLATLTSASLLVVVGAWIDRADLRVYTLCVVAGIATAAAILAFAPPVSVAVLFVAILLLRLCGQGLMGHVAVTTLGRAFERYRGRAISLSGTGHSAGEALWPLVAVAAVAAVGWRGTWAGIVVLMVAVAAPLVLWLLSGTVGRAAAGRAMAVDEGAAPRSDDPRPAPAVPAESWTRRQVLRDPRFYLLLPMVLGPGFINTAIFFAQVPIAAEKGWTMAAFAGGISVFAVTTVAAALVTGPIVDRVTALRLAPVTLVPLALGLCVLAATDAPWSLFVLMGLAGVSQGAFGTMGGALWAEIYGVRHLGAIRSLAVSIMVFSTALSPVMMGRLIDAGVAIETIAAGFVVYIVLSSSVVPLAWQRPARA